MIKNSLSSSAFVTDNVKIYFCAIFVQHYIRIKLIMMGPTSHHCFCMIVRTRFTGTNHVQDLYNNMYLTDKHNNNNNMYRVISKIIMHLSLKSVTIIYYVVLYVRCNVSRRTKKERTYLSHRQAMITLIECDII
jgi:hypothetical protein